MCLAFAVVDIEDGWSSNCQGYRHGPLQARMPEFAEPPEPIFFSSYPSPPARPAADNIPTPAHHVRPQQSERLFQDVQFLPAFVDDAAELPRPRPPDPTGPNTALFSYTEPTIQARAHAYHHPSRCGSLNRPTSDKKGCDIISPGRKEDGDGHRAAGLVTEGAVWQGIILTRG